MTIKVALAGAGAFGIKHLDAIKLIDGVECVSLISRDLDKTREVAAKYGIAHVTTDLADSLALPAGGRGDPVHTHADARRAEPGLPAGRQARAGGDSAVRRAGRRPGRGGGGAGRPAWWPCAATRGASTPATSGCTTRSQAGQFNIQQMDVQTYFFRRSNMNALGQAAQLDRPPAVAPRGAHGGPVPLPDRQRDRGGQRHPGPHPPDAGHRDGHEHPAQGQHRRHLHAELSFNNDGPLGTFFRYIGDSGTYIARYDDLFNGKDQKIDVSQVAVSMNGIELQDREFFAAIREGREPNAAWRRCCPATRCCTSWNSN
jgi:2-hydroxy-4-carboxymuconate semialdehyde hemiacetal dehydrogenase